MSARSNATYESTLRTFLGYEKLNIVKKRIQGFKESNPLAMSKSIISLMRLASHEQVTIYLIEQQLKSRRFFDDLNAIGLGHYDFEPNLDHLILKNVDLDDGTDKTYTQYATILERHSREMQPEYRAIQRQAVKMYSELIALSKQNTAKRK